MTNKHGDTHTPNNPKDHPEHQKSRQHAPRLSNHHPEYNGVHQLNLASYQNGLPYPDADEFCRETARECGDGAGQQEACRSTYQNPHDYGRTAIHQAKLEHGNARPHRRVDRTPYHPAGSEHRHSERRAAVGSQAHSPLQRFQNEPMKEMPWNGIDGFQPPGVPNTSEERRKQQQRYSAHSSLKAENGSSTSFWNPHQR